MTERHHSFDYDYDYDNDDREGDERFPSQQAQGTGTLPIQ
jgi:hypothetical protein